MVFTAVSPLNVKAAFSHVAGEPQEAHRLTEITDEVVQAVKAARATSRTEQILQQDSPQSGLPTGEAVPASAHGVIRRSSS